MLKDAQLRRCWAIRITTGLMATAKRVLPHERERTTFGLVLDTAAVGTTPRVARTPGAPSQFFGHKDTIGIFAIGSKRWTRYKPKTGIQGPCRPKKLHGARFETHPGVAPLLGFLQQMLEQPFRHALAPVGRGGAHRFDFGVLRIEGFECPTPD
jgi:hypothetical protein